MKVLFVGDFYQNTEISKLNRELFYLTLQNKDAKISVLATDINKKYYEDETINKFINQKEETFDICIQNVDPDKQVYSKRCGEHATFLLKDQDVKKNNFITNYYLDWKTYYYIKTINQTKKQNFEAPEQIKKIEKKKIFYTIISQENAESFDPIFIAYHKAFNYYDDVALLIYTDIDIKILNEKMNKISELLGKKRYSQSTLINKKFDFNMLNAIHTYGHCYFGYSSNSDYCMNAFDAAIYDKQAIFATPLRSYGLANYIIHECDYCIRLYFSLIEDFSFYGCNNNRMTCNIKEMSECLRDAESSLKKVKFSLESLPCSNDLIRRLAGVKKA